MKPGNPKFTLEVAKQVLKAKGYSYRQAAPVMGVCYQHLCLVLTGKRESARILRKISELPPRVAPGETTANATSEDAP